MLRLAASAYFVLKQIAFGARALLFLAALALAGPVAAQQVVNPDADVSVAKAAWPSGKGPRVAIDAAHSNFHTVDGRYAPFAALLRNDGYRVVSNSQPFTAKSLKNYDILVIANAMAPKSNEVDEGRSAFTRAEIAAVRSWVNGGGALLLIADHAPFAGAATALGEALGVKFRNGYALDPGNGGKDLFAPHAGLNDHVIVRGAGGDPKITQVRTFTGSAFEAPKGHPLLTLGQRFQMIYPSVPFQMDPKDKREPIAGFLQGATLTIGRGRVVVMGEAAMFSAQMVLPERFLMGFGAPGAEQNQRFALNLMHWLSKRPGY